MKWNIRHSKPSLSGLEIKAVSGALKSGYIASGENVEDFEDKFTKLLKVNSSAAVNSGTSALHLALLALKIKKGDEVIIPSFICASVLNAVLYTGAIPKIADINPFNFNLSREDTKNKVTKRTKAIILAHMFGQPAEIPEFLKLDAPVIENCAQSLGAAYKGKPAGGFGDISIFSFYATKMITAGYGGMVCSKNKNLINYIRDLIEVDERGNYKIRFNYKMPDICAALGRIQLSRLNQFIAARKEIAGFYQQELKSKNITLPQDPQNNHIYFRYVVRVKAGADKIIRALKSKGIEAKRPVFKPLHRYLGLGAEKFPHTEAVFNSAVSLPIYPDLTKSEREFIAQSFNEIVINV